MSTAIGVWNGDVTIHAQQPHGSGAPEPGLPTGVQ
jgi:hypothetical protein